MATQKDLDDIREKTRQLNLQAADLEQQAGQLEGQAQNYATMAQQAAATAAAANADAARIEGKLFELEKWFGIEIEKQRSVMETKAQKITERLDRARDPITGRRLPMDEVSASLFELHRDNPLTADEHDNVLTMNAGEFDADPIKAGEYDVNGKRLLGVG